MEFIERMVNAGLSHDLAYETFRVFMEREDMSGLEAYVVSCEVCAEVI